MNQQIKVGDWVKFNHNVVDTFTDTDNPILIGKIIAIDSDMCCEISSTGSGLWYRFYYDVHRLSDEEATLWILENQ